MSLFDIRFSLLDLENLKNCKTEKEFKKLWNPEKFNWIYSDDLCMYCSKHIHIWWDPEKFHWNYSYYLCMYCSEYIHIWWDADKFYWKWTNLLRRYCKQYKDIWEKDYIIKKLEGEIR